MGIRAIIVDTAGTTTDHAFIHDVLFPYSIKAMPTYLAQHKDDVLVDNCICDTREMALEEDASIERVAEILQQWVKEDRKATPLKTLQGLIWKEGYAKGEFTGHIFPDFIDAATRFKARGIRLYSFSSASAEAQKLLFSHSDGGDLTEIFNGHFDTRTGGKQDKQAYSNIINTISMAPKQVMFISDLADELKAAQSAGLQTCQMLRDPAEAAGSFRHIRSFNDLQLS
ncbi:haloacid dehalogenase [Shewanella mangrovi]|uniref:Enolase-phosphatase E1 n=1 Tax=Shewanella mangrovi TaxID=1515746 RepID=A0A094J8L0_9GAMM|nr:acireductone synthase [Shewanella mangrovi]KFZ36270.1 haloacid dehalogenase [Shewanella mangrovi]